MNWIELASAIAVGVAVGRELSRWLGYLTEPLRMNLDAASLRRRDRISPSALGGQFDEP